MTDTVLGTKFRGGQNFLFTVGGFFNKREYSGADRLDLLIYIFFYTEKVRGGRRYMICDT